MSARTVAGLAVLAAVGAGGVALLRAPGGTEASGGDAPAPLPGSPADCGACHAEAYREWSASWHARAFTEPNVRALSNDFANADCVDCHAPRPVFVTGLEERVLPRDERREDGVDCMACHALGGADAGRVAGTIDRPDAPCRPKRVAALSQVESCAPCHNLHQTVTEWLVSRYASEGVGCIDCHMPFRDGDPARGRDHTAHGGHSLELLRSAVELRARRDRKLVRVEVENVGAGHWFPTDERSRAADVFWRPLGPDAGPWRHLHRFRSPYRHEELEDTRIPAHATHEVLLKDPDADGGLEVALFYKLTPYWADPEAPDPEREAVLVERVEVP